MALTPPQRTDHGCEPVTVTPDVAGLIQRLGGQVISLRGSVSVIDPLRMAPTRAVHEGGEC